MKRRYDFRLARVLGVREIEEKQARLAWVQADRTAREAEEAAAATRRELVDLRLELSAARSSSDLPRALLLERLTDARVTELARRVQRAHTLSQQAERLSETWREADRRRRALAELEDRGRKNHRRAVEEADQRELDERASSVRRFRPGDPEEGSSSTASMADEVAGLPAPPPPR